MGRIESQSEVKVFRFLIGMLTRVPESKGQILFLESKSKEQQQEKQVPVQKGEPK